MARGGKIASKYKTRKKILVEKKGSDESDEDYMVGEDEEFDESEDESCFSPTEDESEESMEEFEEEEWEKKKVNNIRRPRGRKVFQGRKNTGVIMRERKRVAQSDEEEDRVNEKFDGARPTKNGMLSCIKEDEDEDYDFDDSEYENDEEFTPDEIDGGDDEDELSLINRNKLSRLRMPETAIAKGQKRKRNAKVLKRTKRKKPEKEKVVRRYNRSDFHNAYRDQNSILQKKKKISEHRGRRKKSSVNSDLNFMNSGSSDHDYTVSEEEREQVREAAEFCGSLTSSWRSSSSLKMIKEEIVPSQRQHPGTKGKEKVVDMKFLVGKQVCGICLSEEGKRTIWGILNCCSHYFCFACIMEWSKVESRCPLCKQRFSTISRTAQVDGEFALGDTVIPVPERDQVYQPSEEELRAFLDPYENVLCTECQQGGEDALMLLCDLCDSPAHTYCVGLGREVPEGNWYCDGCKPTAITSANAQALNPNPENGANSHLSVGSWPSATVQETFDLNELYVANAPLTHVTGHSSSPRQPSGDFQGASPTSGSGAFTLYERRRRIQRQIYQLLNSRSRHVSRSDGGAQASGISFFGSEIGQDALITPQHVTPALMAPENNYYPGRFCDYANPSICRRFSSLRGQILDSQATASTDHSFVGHSHRKCAGINSRFGRSLGHQQLQPCGSRSKSGDDTSISLYQFREVSRSPLEKEQVQSMVRSHLKSLSRNLKLGYTTFKDIARTSTHTILAAVGVEHRPNEVYPVRTRPLSCDHCESRNTRPTGGQCSSCFDWFVRSLVREVMYTRVSPWSMG